MTERVLILVVGPHRGGTSATAGALHHGFGVSFGDVLMPPSPANPKGYFEDMQAVGLHEHILAVGGATWDRPWNWWPSPHLPRAVLCRQAREEAYDSARAILRRLFDSGPASLTSVRGLKDPRATLFPWIWDEACRREGISLRPLRVQRKVSSVADSLQARDGIDAKTALRIARHYDERAHRLIDETQGAAEPAATIRFPWDLHVAECWQRVEAELALRFPLHQYDALRKFVDPELIHHG